jgi:hypothetical protein
MNDDVQRGRPDERLFRNEKRLPTLIPVYLASLHDPSNREETTTENISPHGARVISKRSWRPGEGSIVTGTVGGFAQAGRVIYCLPRVGDRFCLGIEFPDRAVKWAELSSA